MDEIIWCNVPKNNIRERYKMESIYAVDLANGISKKGTIPWTSKKDMAFFVHQTKHHIVLMGKRTYFSIPPEHRPLKHRLNIVITTTPEKYTNETRSNLIFTNNIHIHQDIFAHRTHYGETYPFLDPEFTVFCIGGKQLYEQLIPFSRTVWVSRIKHDYACDLRMEYDYSCEFREEVYEENDELDIVKYTRI